MALRRIGALGAALLACLLLAAPSAQAFEKGFWGPVSVDGVSQFPTYAKLGVTLFQTQLDWSAVAPTRPANPTDPADPAYRWPAEIDEAIAEGRKHDIDVLLLAIRAPRWANGDRPSNVAPDDPQLYADFLTAASRRYPAVRRWMIWGEPTRAGNWQPISSGGVLSDRLNATQRIAPTRYAALLDRAYGALKAVSARNLVIGGNSFSGGDIRARAWVRYLRLPDGRPPRMDLYGHNPFSLRTPNLRNPPSKKGVVDFSDLGRFQKVVDEYIGRRAAPPNRRTHVRLFLSEFTVPTGKDREFNYRATPAAQARFITQGFRVARRLRAYGLGWIHLIDEPKGRKGGRSQGGLLYANGKRKPGFRAFANG